MLSIPHPRFLLTAFISSLMMLTACSKSGDGNQSATKNSEQTTSNETLETTDDNKPSYVVGTVKTFKPFIMRDDQLQLTGFDIDMINAIAKDQNFNITFAVVPREELLYDIENNKYDMAIAGISVTPERQEKLQFSDPYFVSHKAVIAKADAPVITSLSELIPYHVSVIANGTSAKILEGIMTDNSNIEYVETPFSSIQQVILGESTYALGDSPVLAYYAKELNDQNLKVYTDTNSTPENYGIIFAPNRDDDLVQKVNLGLEHIKADGTYQAIEKKWFGQ
ncbi:substrate-binding periplasmic protein [Psychrobacter sp. I-STPA10]|uniref:substrate-binding periplasmic protein n=1 Tax=Psychrobacter sp. I-STPA10 TaxID=2585769 RepID=UPI001E5CCBD0|nr:transporter substrate-binding domain-containing protein [Psychrobacter sp. I-STPA10]